MTHETEFKVGDTVRVKDPDDFIAEVRNKVRGRTGRVISVLDAGTVYARLNVIFNKRNGRGKEFCRVMAARYFERCETESAA